MVSNKIAMNTTLTGRAHISRANLFGDRHLLAPALPLARAVSACAASKEAAKVEGILPPEELIALCKEYHENSYFSTGATEYQERVMAPDFVFRGPAIGPYTRDDYLQRVARVAPRRAFPDLKFDYWGHAVDPNNPMRVWFFAQITGTMTKDWEVRGQVFPATNKSIESGLEAHSLEWTADRKLRYQSVGYCVDRFYSNSPDGSTTVAVFAAFKAAEASWVLKILFNPLFETVMNLIGEPQATRWENLPEWYKKLPASKLKGSQGINRI